MAVLNKAYPDFEERRWSRKRRERAIGAGGKFKLSLEDREINRERDMERRLSCWQVW